MKIALDTNVIVYAIGIDDSERQIRALTLIENLPTSSIVLTAQVLAELYRMLVGKVGLKKAEASQIANEWASRYTVHGMSPDAILHAIRLAANHTFTIWDAIVLSSAADAGCQILLSEDMHHGFTWSGVTIVNPFLQPMHPQLEQALAQ